MANDNPSPPGRRGKPSPPGRGIDSPPGRRIDSPPGRGIDSPPGRRIDSPPGRGIDSPPRGISSLMRSLSRPDFRSAFRDDPAGAVQKQGLDAASLPEDQLRVLAELSKEELETVVSVVGRLRDANAGRSVSL